MRALALLAVVLVGPSFARAQEHRLHPVDAAAVAGFADEFFPREMAARQIPGLVFVFVSGGEIVVSRGFGAAQLEPRRPVDPDRTRFRLASVSKTITATAALKLVEEGRLDLHKNVNAYLTGFQVADERGAITLHHLLTHTAGFNERLTGMAARSAQMVQPLAAYLGRSMPRTFVEPGRVISYSNHGFGLIGLLVQQTSGRPFADYVQEQIFAPLEMVRSGAFGVHVPTDLAVAYDVAGGSYRELSPEYLQLSPAGAFFTTGADMGRFLIAHLRGGEYQGRRILQSDTVALMHTQHFAQSPGTSGWAYGFWEDTRNGERALLHNGGGKGYRALIYLLPQQDAGFFLAYNRADQHPQGELQELFITEYRTRFVAVRQRVDVRTDVPASADERFVGEYLYVRRARNTVEKFIAGVNRVRIAIGQNRTLTMAGPRDGPVVLTPIGPRVFRRADARGVVAFEPANPSGPGWLMVVADSGFPAVYERIALSAAFRVQVGWLSAMAIVFLYATCRPLVGVSRRGPKTSNAHRSSIWLGGIASALNLTFMVGFPLAFLGRVEGGFPEFVYGVPPLATILLLVPPTTTLMGIAASIGAVRLWRHGRASTAARLGHSLVAVALLSFGVFAWYWNVLLPPER